MGVVVNFPRRAEHLEAEYDRLLNELREITDNPIMPGEAQARKILRKHAELYPIVTAMQAGE